MQTLGQNYIYENEKAKAIIKNEKRFWSLSIENKQGRIVILERNIFNTKRAALTYLTAILLHY